MPTPITHLCFALLCFVNNPFTYLMPKAVGFPVSYVVDTVSCFEDGYIKLSDERCLEFSYLIGVGQLEAMILYFLHLAN